MTNPFITIGGKGMFGEIGEVCLHLLVDSIHGLLEQGLVEVTKAHLAREVVDSLVAPLRCLEQLIEKGAHVFCGRYGEFVNVSKPPLEDGHDRSQLLVDVLVRLIDQQQTLIELG